jgi:ABC-type transport system involved in multi-copper enzyme maturation permease subunit
MPIYDLGYRHWAGRWTSHPYRWWVITRQGIALLVRRKLFVALMFLSTIPFLVRSVMIYFSSTAGTVMPGFMQVNASFFENFLSQQMFFAFAIAIYAGAGLISNDLKANALQIYLSKPITRQDYFIGKLGVVVFFLAMPTLLPGLLLLILGMLFRADAEFFVQSAWLAGPIVGYSILIMFTYGLIILALSALTKSSRFAGINFAAVFFFTQILQAILSAIFRSSHLAWISVRDNLSQLGAFLFRGAAQYQSPVWLSAAILLILMAGSAWLVHRRVQAVEVVS